MAIQLLCRKLGTTQIFAENGDCIPVTVLVAGPNTVVQTKTVDKDGYTALQLSFGERKPSRTARPLAGHFRKANVAPSYHLRESRITPEEAQAHAVGQQITVDIFEKGQRVDVIGTSKGRGTAGVVKRHGFAVKRKTHGTHEAFRHGGAIGAGSYPGRVFKGMSMAGRLGNRRVTSLNLEVVEVDPERSLLFIRGAVPGHRNGVVCVRPTVRSRA
ncbi:MAG: 50S ribosomal protein L3 [Myxococcales bacterium]|nr:50S ribosomal protein L3 [Myxococcales bacterium]